MACRWQMRSYGVSTTADTRTIEGPGKNETRMKRMTKQSRWGCRGRQKKRKEASVYIWPGQRYPASLEKSPHTLGGSRVAKFRPCLPSSVACTPRSHKGARGSWKKDEGGRQHGKRKVGGVMYPCEHFGTFQNRPLSLWSAWRREGRQGGSVGG